MCLRLKCYPSLNNTTLDGEIDIINQNSIPPLNYYPACVNKPVYIHCMFTLGNAVTAVAMQIPENAEAGISD